jgi:transposase
LEGLQEVHDQAEALLLEQAAKTPEVRRLATAPGIAAIRASQIVAIVITPHRFRTKRQFWSYSGLAVVTVVSAEWEKDSRREWTRRKVPQTRGLNRNRHPMLKSVFKGAALAVITTMPQHPLHRAYQEHVKKGMDPALARLTLARRIAAAALAMWKTQEDYDPTKHANQT